MSNLKFHTRDFVWGVILAAGDGKRMQRYIQQETGSDLPKQYYNFIGRRSMLEHTFDRAERLIPPTRLLTVVGGHHLKYVDVKRQLSDRPRETIIVQPENRDTGPGILLPLMFLYKHCPEAIATVFPSDHFILEEDRFTKHVYLATQAVESNPSQLVLLGIKPSEAETEYGYIVAGEECRQVNPWRTRKVLRFIEKPDRGIAFHLVKTGGLWNTMVMVFKVRALFEMVRRLCPSVYLRFRTILKAIGTPEERETIEAVYRDLEPMNFSKGLLERISTQYPDSISVLPVLQVCWSDWGSPRRVLEVLERSEPKRLPDDGFMTIRREAPGRRSPRSFV